MTNPKPDSPKTPIRPEMSDWAIGDRVMVRVMLPQGSTHVYTDHIGYIREMSSQQLSLETRQGMVTIATSDVAIGKQVPPPPAPRARRAELY